MKTPAPTTASQVDTPIVFYDGVCGLCNRFVHWVLRRDKRGQFRFAPLQGETAARMLPDRPEQPEVWSVILTADGHTWQASAAALRIIAGVGGIWSLVRILLLIPAPLRDVIYRWIARNRYRWFGKHDACPMPDPSHRDRFLP